VLLPLAFWDGLLAFRQAGWAIDDGRLVLREGGLSRRTVVAPLGRLQWRSVVQTPLARRARLATTAAAVASGGEGGGLRIRHLDEAAAFGLLARLVTPAGSCGGGHGAADGAALPVSADPFAVGDEAKAAAGYT
jgi:uncharacterized membrane protein YdbT with pleckstrin-like domain